MEKKKQDVPVRMPPRRVEPPRMFPVLNPDRIMAIIEAQCGDVHIAKRYGEGANKVFILPEAYEEFCGIVSYGRRSPMNRLEQKYAGYGHFFVDDRGRAQIVISHFIQIPTMNRGSVSAENLGPNGEANPGLDFLAYYREEFMQHEKECNTDSYGKTVDPFLKRYGSSEFVLEGHTHPDLGVFWSRIDRVSGAARAATAPICIFVCDPIRRQMLGCVGKDFAPAQIIVYERQKGNLSKNSLGNELMNMLWEWLEQKNAQGELHCKNHLGGRTSLKIKLVLDEKGQKK